MTNNSGLNYKNVSDFYPGVYCIQKGVYIAPPWIYKYTSLLTTFETYTDSHTKIEQSWIINYLFFPQPYLFHTIFHKTLVYIKALVFHRIYPCYLLNKNVHYDYRYMINKR